MGLPANSTTREDPANDGLSEHLDLAAFVPTEVYPLANPQTDIPRIARDEDLVRLIDDAVGRIPTNHALHLGDARKMDALPPESVHLVVTSPPFLDIVQYAADNWLRGWFAGIDPAGVQISTHRRLEDWTAFVARTFVELERVVRPGGHVAFEVGEVRGGTVELELAVLQAMRGLAFEPLGVLVNTQDFTKTANCWGVSNNAKGVNTNRVVLARRL